MKPGFAGSARSSLLPEVEEWDEEGLKKPEKVKPQCPICKNEHDSLFFCFFAMVLVVGNILDLARLAQNAEKMITVKNFMNCIRTYFSARSMQFHQVPKRKKLLTLLHDKKNYVIHYTYIQQAIKNGLKLTKIHKILEFDQKPFLKTYMT